MADGILPLSPASAGGQIEDVEQLNVPQPIPPAPPPGQIRVIRQRIEVVGRLYNQIAAVLDVDPAAGDFGLVVRAVGAAKEATLQIANVLLAAIRDRLPVTLGQKTSSTSLAVVLPNENYDAFGRIRTSQPLSLFDSKQIFDAQPLYWDDQQTSGAGTSSTYSSNTASSTLSVSAATAGTRVRQTFRRFNYQSGKSQLINETGVIGTPAVGITRQIGIFDAQNGLFFQSAPAGISVVRRTFVTGVAVDNVTLQAAWNLDPLDGSGPSGITLDPSKVQIFLIDFEWLGTGAIRFGFVINDEIIYVHRIDVANNLTTVWASKPNLPLRYEISNDGTGGAASLVEICATVISEGGSPSTGSTRAIGRGTVPMTTLNNTNIYPVVSIRLQAGFSAADIRTAALSIVCTSNATYNWYLVLNPTVVGAALAFTPVVNSAVEADVVSTNATTITAGTGTVIASGVSQQFQEGNTQIIEPSDLQLGVNIAGVSDILVLAVQRVVGGAETFFTTLQWRETV